MPKEDLPRLSRPLWILGKLTGMLPKYMSSETGIGVDPDTGEYTNEGSVTKTIQDVLRINYDATLRAAKAELRRLEEEWDTAETSFHRRRIEQMREKIRNLIDGKSLKNDMLEKGLLDAYKPSVDALKEMPSLPSLRYDDAEEQE